MNCSKLSLIRKVHVKNTCERKVIKVLFAIGGLFVEFFIFCALVGIFVKPEPVID